MDAGMGDRGSGFQSVIPFQVMCLSQESFFLDEC